jgi:hypothetical protein
MTFCRSPQTSPIWKPVSTIFRQKLSGYIQGRPKHLNLTHETRYWAQKSDHRSIIYWACETEERKVDNNNNGQHRHHTYDERETNEHLRDVVTRRVYSHPSRSALRWDTVSGSGGDATGSVEWRFGSARNRNWSMAGDKGLPASPLGTTEFPSNSINGGGRSWRRN